MSGMTDVRLRQPNDTGREPAVRAFTGNGCASRLHEDQVPGFAHRVRMYAHLRGVTFETVAEDIGLRGELRAQVLAALEAE